MKRRMSFITAPVVAILLTLVPTHAAHAHHESWIGAPLWHEAMHLFENGVPWLAFVAAAVLVMRFRRRAER